MDGSVVVDEGCRRSVDAGLSQHYENCKNTTLGQLHNYLTVGNGIGAKNDAIDVGVNRC